jgi:hypothetical protein
MNNFTFENYMQEQFARLNPQVLDDDMPDKFDAWVERLDVGQVWAYANAAIEEIKKEKRTLS